METALVAGIGLAAAYVAWQAVTVLLMSAWDWLRRLAGFR